MTKKQAQWLVDFYKPRMGYRVDGKTIQWHIDAINIINNTSRGVPSCKCEYLITAKIAQSTFAQHEEEIMKLYNEVPKRTKKGL